VTFEAKIGCFKALAAIFAIALWLISVPDPAPQPIQRLIGLEGKVSAHTIPPIMMEKRISNTTKKFLFFIQTSFLFIKIFIL
jgi:hypothetical protein